MADFAYITKGFHEVEAAFTETAFRVDPVVGKALRQLAKPVQRSAQDLAVANMSNIGTGSSSWSRMRVGRKRVEVYVVEKQHSQGGDPRSGFLPRIMDTALRPALEMHRGEIHAGVDAALALMLKENF